LSFFAAKNFSKHFTGLFTALFSSWRYLLVWSGLSWLQACCHHFLLLDIIKTVMPE
jgi:hypothetical protein